MTQIKNPENGNQKGTVTIVGYSERFFMNAAPPVHIMKDLLEIGKVEKNGKIELDIDKESRIVFKCNQCSCRFSPCVVKPDDWVVLIYDRAVDSMLPIITNEENHIRIREEFHEYERRRRKKFFLRVLLIVLLVCGVSGGISGGIHVKHVREKKVEWAKYLKARGLFNIENPHLYTIEELKKMQFGESVLPYELREKMEKNGDLGYSPEFNSVESQSSDNISMREISRHPWKRVILGDPYGACLLEVLSFSENGNGNCRHIKYAGGNAVSASNFSFSYYIEGEKVYCSGTWEYVFRGGKLYDKQNNPYKSGSSL